MNILVTGSNGFIAKNIIQFLSEQQEVNILSFNRQSSDEDLADAVKKSDWIVHLAGVNRPLNEQEFIEGNVSLTQKIANLLKSVVKKHLSFYPLLFRQSAITLMVKAS